MPRLGSEPRLTLKTQNSKLKTQNSKLKTQNSSSIENTSDPPLFIFEYSVTHASKKLVRFPIPMAAIQSNGLVAP